VIGGGYTGVAAARQLAKQGASVVLLEARTLGWGASTRNGGIAHPGYKWGPASMVKRYGQELATRLYADSVKPRSCSARTIREAGIEAELRLNGYMELAWSRRDAEDFAGEVPVRTSWGTPARVVPREELAAEVGTTAYHGGLASIPAVSSTRASGSRGSSAWPRQPARTSTKASTRPPFDAGPTGISPSRPTAARSLVATSSSRPTPTPDGAAPALRRRIIPIGSYIVATEPLPEDLAREISPTGPRLLRHAQLPVVLARERGPSPPLGRPRELLPDDRRQDGKAAPPAHARGAPAGRRVPGRVFVGGKIGMTFDRMPHIGRSGGVMYAMGCCGSGVVLLHWLGTRAAEWMGGGQPPALAKLRFPLVPAPYEGRPWFLPVVGEYFRARDRLAARH
jgi:glycine/D-amino acid oxidase-like deaminating enzyme